MKTNRTFELFKNRLKLHKFTYNAQTLRNGKIEPNLKNLDSHEKTILLKIY